MIVLASLLVIFDVGKNLTEEMRITSEQKALFSEPIKPQAEIEPTLSEEELRQWAERLQKCSDTRDTISPGTSQGWASAAIQRWIAAGPFFYFRG